MDWARCEISADGLLDQPFDLITGLLAALAGVWLVRRDHPLVGGALAVSGIASAGYHAWAGAFTGWLDAVGVALLAVAFAADTGRWSRGGVALGGVAVAVLTAPEALRAGVTGVVVVGAVALVLLRARISRTHLLAAAALFAVGLLSWWVAADAARCSTAGWLPLHAVWHATAVAAVTVLVIGRRPPSTLDAIDRSARN